MRCQNVIRISRINLAMLMYAVSLTSLLIEHNESTIYNTRSALLNIQKSGNSIKEYEHLVYALSGKVFVSYFSLTVHLLKSIKYIKKKKEDNFKICLHCPLGNFFGLTNFEIT